MRNSEEMVKDTQGLILHKLLHHKKGLTIDALAECMHISRNAVRQHLMALERDEMVSKGDTKATGGRPHQLYILAPKGVERFPKQYSWFSELLLRSLLNQEGEDGLEKKLIEMGNAVGRSMKDTIGRSKNTLEKISLVADKMTSMGYDAFVSNNNGVAVIEAYNCVFHQLAEKYPQVCGFDVALISSASGCNAEQSSCMLRGGTSCKFILKDYV